MFCKLFKYDMKELIHKVWLMYFFILLTALIVRGTSMLGENVSIFSYISGAGMILLIVASVIICIWAFIIGIRHFYQKMLTDEGYLTNTLPTRQSTILTSKTLSMVLMIAITIAVIVVGLFLAFYEKEAWEAFWNRAEQTLAIEGINLSHFLAVIFGICALNLVTIQLVIQCSLAIGHSFSQNKIGYSILFGFIFYVAYQILGVIGLGVVFLSNPNLFEQINTDIPPVEVFTPIFGIVGIVLATLSITSIFLSHHFMKNKLNLE